MPDAVAAESTELPAGAETSLPSIVMSTNGPYGNAGAGLPDFHQIIALAAVSMILPVDGIGPEASERTIEIECCLRRVRYMYTSTY